MFINNEVNFFCTINNSNYGVYMKPANEKSAAYVWFCIGADSAMNGMSIGNDEEFDSFEEAWERFEGLDHSFDAYWIHETMKFGAVE